MIRAPRTDFWRCGIVPAPMPGLSSPAGWSGLAPQIVWLPDPGPWRYLADPFGLWRNSRLHVFVEAFDYRTKCAHIECHQFGRDLSRLDVGPVLKRPFHLSYPFLIEAAGEVFMIPESHRAGEIALYRARSFPDQWARECALLPGIAGVDASVVRHQGRWWMFFSIAGGGRDQRELHLAHAPRLTGPWSLHPLNPVVTDPAGARPGGTPRVEADGSVVVPVQDCSRTYGGALRFLRFSVLDTRHAVFRHDPAVLTGELASPAHPHGLHTLSSCGEYTLVDVKATTRTWVRHLINARRSVARVFSHPD